MTTTSNRPPNRQPKRDRDRDRDTVAEDTARPGLRGRIAEINRQMSSNALLDYVMIVLLIFLLTGLGAVMVFSSSMTWSAAENSSVWSEAARHVVMIGIGAVGFWFALKFPLGWVRRLAPILMWITLALLILAEAGLLTAHIVRRA